MKFAYKFDRKVADMHYGEGWTMRCKDMLPSQFAGCFDLNSTWFLRRMIGAEKLGLIIFSAILGNHDQESTMSRAELMAIISLMDYSVSKVNPPNLNGDHASIDGFGNYNIVVHGASGSELANTSVLNLYLLDSGMERSVMGVRLMDGSRSLSCNGFLNFPKDFKDHFKVILTRNEGSITTLSYGQEAYLEHGFMKGPAEVLELYLIHQLGAMRKHF